MGLKIYLRVNFLWIVYNSATGLQTSPRYFPRSLFRELSITVDVDAGVSQVWRYSLSGHVSFRFFPCFSALPFFFQLWILCACGWSEVDLLCFSLAPGLGIAYDGLRLSDDHKVGWSDTKWQARKWSSAGVSAVWCSCRESVASTVVASSTPSGAMWDDYIK